MKLPPTTSALPPLLLATEKCSLHKLLPRQILPSSSAPQSFIFTDGSARRDRRNKFQSITCHLTLLSWNMTDRKTFPKEAEYSTNVTHVRATALPQKITSATECVTTTAQEPDYEASTGDKFCLILPLNKSQKTPKESTETKPSRSDALTVTPLSLTL